MKVVLFVSLWSLTLFFSCFSEESKEANLADVFKDMDANNNGKVTKKEVSTCIFNVVSTCLWHFTSLSLIDHLTSVFL